MDVRASQEFLPCLQENENFETFHIEDLLDLSKEEDVKISGPIEHENGTSILTEECTPSASFDWNSSSSDTLLSEVLPASMLCIPMDMADLDWLSTFEEESFCLPDFNPAVLTPFTDLVNRKEEKTESITESHKPICNIPVRTRSERTRKAGLAWHRIRPLKPRIESRTKPYTPELSDCSSSSSVVRSPKKPKTKSSGVTAGKKLPVYAPESSHQRKCSHCQVTKTPQWRAGPLGPKTLCNACGVRYNSGRLVPEYRPAVSPCFDSQIHSNSHRKIVEMRRLKEQQNQHQHT